ncbi:MAG TPA: valine--tRNA ligase [Candidatus Methylacidiphilales bacterium]|nr:valine--tRNA ligase [Candidatus Methylacidiphilales bacterium]
MPELAKAYEPQQVEDRLYKEWQEGGYFRADPKSSKKPYSIVMPPPNVTGKLTLGHVLNNTLQDILSRKARMEGKEVLWLPGTDHAGLATQTAVERHLRNTEKKTRHDFTREEFVARVWKWKEEFGGIITRQLRKLGASCDWSRERFTMDQDYERAVQEVFVKLYNEGLIYRGTRMVNWCPGSLTALSDEEVIPTKQKGSLYYVKYQLADEPRNYLVVATTRPETIMADVALAVKPGGKWAHLVGRKVIRPLHHAEIPIIADEAVEEGFGTGVLKVTPAHDKADYEIGKRHNLPIIGILTPNAKIHDPGEHDTTELNGLERFEARKRSAEILKERGLLEKEEPYENNVGFSERAGVPIEPRLSEQWFLKYPNIAEALALLRDGHVKFHPEHWTKTYEHWLDNIQDWCISRQVWWGHRIPVWYRSKAIEVPRGTANPLGIDPSILANNEVRCQIEKPKGEDWVQDEDSLDTWFSSWLWAYETMRTEDGTRRKFYPTSALVTGPDIIFLWVARMLIAGLHFKPNGDKPTEAETLEANLAFKDVYFTGLIRDKQGRKLSKSLGNSPDPLDLIAKYGADGLRFGLIRIAPQGQDIRFDEKQIEEGRNFCNKLWNICRFRAMQGPIDPKADPSKHARSIFADELLQTLWRRIEGDGARTISAQLNSYSFSEAAATLYDFVWNDFASRFVEAAKVDFAQSDSPTRAGTLATFDYVMSRVLRLLHPFAPFVTEELWHQLGFGKETIQFEEWPTKSYRPQEYRLRAFHIYETADKGRNLRSEIKIPSNQKIPFLLLPSASLPEGPLRNDQIDVLKAFLNASELTLLKEAPANPGPMTFAPLGQLYLPATGLVDPTAERDRLTKELAKVEKDLEQTHRKLGDANMLAKAPPAKVEEWRALEASLAAKEKSLRESLRRLEE